MGDLAINPQWQEDVVSISFLSTQREGPGTRWRHSTVKGSDVVVEVSAWYDTLGYEYRIVDGTAYSENNGRMRLHEVSDGTLVRWTFQYEPSGVLGGLRNTMRLKRGTSNQIQDSLRNLHQLIVQESGGISTHEAKATMQSAPDVSERSSYQPRHPSAFHEPAEDDIAVDEDTSLSERLPLMYDLDLEPEAISAVTDTDTKPNPVVLGAGIELAPTEEPAPVLDDTRPVEVETFLAELSPPADVLPAADVLPTAEPAPLEDPQPEKETAAGTPPPPVESEAKQGEDSANLSVFEIFGLQKPSEARAQAEPASDTFDDVQELMQGRESRLAPVPDIGSGDSAADPAPENSSRQPDERSVGSGISGWRRSARRRQTRLRSHS